MMTHLLLDGVVGAEAVVIVVVVVLAMVLLDVALLMECLPKVLKLWLYKYLCLDLVLLCLNSLILLISKQYCEMSLS